MSIATLLINATVDAVRETDRVMLDAIQRSASPFNAAAAQQWYDQRDYDAMRRSLMEQVQFTVRRQEPAYVIPQVEIPYTPFTDMSPVGGLITDTSLVGEVLSAYKATGSAPSGAETTMLRPGDRVKVLRAMTDEEKDKPPGWNTHMDELVGKVGVVTWLDGDKIGVRHDQGSYTWLLNMVEAVPAEQPAATEVPFGPFPSKEEAHLERTVQYNPVWEAKSPTGELSFVRCYPSIGDVDTFASFQARAYTKSEKFPKFKDYSARLLDKDGKPTERKHIALTTTVASPSITVTNASSTTIIVPPGATAVEVVAAAKAQGVDCARSLSTGTATAAEVAAAKWRDFPTMEEVRAAPFTVWAIQRPDGSVFHGYFVVAEQYIYLQQSTDKGVILGGDFSEPFSELRELKAHTVLEQQTDIKCNTLVRIVVVQSDLNALERGTVVAAKRSTVGEPLCPQWPPAGHRRAGFPFSFLPTSRFRKSPAPEK